MSEKLYELANKVGVVQKYIDAGLSVKEYVASDDCLRDLLFSLGFDASTNQKIEKSLGDFEDRRWKKVLSECYFISKQEVVFDVVLPFAETLGKLSFEIINSKEKKQKLIYEIKTLEQRKVSSIEYVRLEIKAALELEIGYYDLVMKNGSKEYLSKLIVVPEKCYEIDDLNKEWGFALQLYSLRSKRNWGIGDFTDLYNFVDICAANGASLIGLNPLNVLSHDYPENASPYSSISRLFLNPIYIDVENVPEFDKKDLKLVEEDIKKARDSELILYEIVYPAKIKVLEKIYARFVKNADKKRTSEFDDFCKEKGIDLDHLAIFQTLSMEKSKILNGGWKAWEKEYQNPKSKEITDYVIKNKDKIGFFKFLQFESNRQLKLAHERAKKKGLIGFYQDLAVGVGQDSAEFWSDSNNIFMKNVGAGAPPDAFFPAGQSWGLGAFNPYKLKEQAYEPFIKVLRATMSFAGSIRMDHVMSLARLYIISDKYKSGSYIKYNLDEMLSIVALESHLNKCMVVGESIGNVPEGFLESLEEKHVSSLSVLWAERYDMGWGDFVQPDKYKRESYVSVGSHDMAPLRMWWFGYDIEVSYSFGFIESEEDKKNSYHKRENDRQKLLNALDFAGVWPSDNQRSGNYMYGEQYPEGIEEAVHRFLAKSGSKVFLVMPEDILHAEKLQNLPGTNMEHPNWRRKLSVELEKLEEDIRFVRNVKVIREER